MVLGAPWSADPLSEIRCPARPRATRALPHARISTPPPGGPSGAQSMGRAGRSVPGSARRLVIPLRDASKGLGSASSPATGQPRGMRWPTCGLPVRVASFRTGRDGFRRVTGSVRSAPAKVEKQVKSWIRFQYMQQRTDEQVAPACLPFPRPL